MKLKGILLHAMVWEVIMSHRVSVICQVILHCQVSRICLLLLQQMHCVLFTLYTVAEASQTSLQSLTGQTWSWLLIRSLCVFHCLWFVIVFTGSVIWHQFISALRSYILASEMLENKRIFWRQPDWTDIVVYIM